MTEHTRLLSEFIADPSPLPAEVSHAARRHTLDTLAAIISGADLAAGRFGVAEARETGGNGQSAVMGLPGSYPAPLAAYANAMCAHADETDDSHAPSITHPGCSVIPSALAAAQATDADDATFLAGVAKGYELCGRFGVALGAAEFITERGFDSHAFGGIFGAVAAAGSVYGLDPRACETSLSLTAHQASGLATLFRDRLHVEKAFVFAGMPARNGSWAALAALRGLVGVAGSLESAPGFFSAFGEDPGDLSAGLGERWAVTGTNIKRWCVGSPIQAALDSVEALMVSHALTWKSVERIDVQLSNSGARVVDNRDMPNVNLQHLVALMLVDGHISFANSHDHARMDDPRVAGLRALVSLTASEELTRLEPSRQALVAIRCRDGTCLEHRTTAVRGTAQNPMTDDEIASKFMELVGGRQSRQSATILTEEILQGRVLVAMARAMAPVRTARHARPTA